MQKFDVGEVVKIVNFASQIDVGTSNGPSRRRNSRSSTSRGVDARRPCRQGRSRRHRNPDRRRRHPGRSRGRHRLRHDRAPTRFAAADIAGKDTARLRSSLESANLLSAGNYNQSLDRYVFTKAPIERLEHLAAEGNVDLSHSPKWKEQLGALGGGNHFIKLCIDERDAVWMFLHSGSRGVGNKIATRHINVAKQRCRDNGVSLPNADLAYLEEGTPEFDTYIAELRWAQTVCALRTMNVDADDVELERLNSDHNCAAPERHGDKDVWLTRKGAVDARQGVMGNIPGSMGTRSYVVRGKGNPDSLCSAPHGADRRFSRSEAWRRFTAADLAARMEGIEYRHGEAWVDEIPGAYKPIDVVMADSAGLVEVVTTLHQVVNVKGT